MSISPPHPDEHEAAPDGDSRITRSSELRREKQAQAPARPAKSYAIWLLARRDYSAASLRRKLQDKGYPEADIEAALRFVIDNKYQSDARFAEQRSRGAESRAGNVRIEMKLRQQGIAPELAREQIRQLGPEEERAVQAAAKYRRQVAQEGMTAQLEARIQRFLAYRGFSSRAIRQALEALRDAASDEAEPAE